MFLFWTSEKRKILFIETFSEFNFIAMTYLK